MGGSALDVCYKGAIYGIFEPALDTALKVAATHTKSPSRHMVADLNAGLVVVKGGKYHAVTQ